MEDAVRVQEGDAASELGGDLPDAGLVEAVVGLAPIGQEAGQVAVLAELGLDEQVAVLLPRVAEVDEMRRAVVGRGDEAEDVDLFQPAQSAVSAASINTARRTDPWARQRHAWSA